MHTTIRPNLDFAYEEMAFGAGVEPGTYVVMVHRISLDDYAVYTMSGDGECAFVGSTTSYSHACDIHCDHVRTTNELMF